MNPVLDDLIQGRSVSDDVMMLAESVSDLKVQGYMNIPTSDFFNAYRLVGKGMDQITEPIEIKSWLKEFLTGNSFAEGRVVFVRKSSRLLEFNLKVKVGGQEIELCVSASLHFADEHMFIENYGNKDLLSTTEFENKINDLIKSYAIGSSCREDFISKLGSLEKDFYDFIEGGNTGLYATVKVYVVAVSEKEKTELEQYQHDRETEQKKKIIHFTSEQEFKELKRAADVEYQIDVINGKAEIIPPLNGYKDKLNEYEIKEVERKALLARVKSEADHKQKYEELISQGVIEAARNINEKVQVEHEIDVKKIKGDSVIDRIARMREITPLSPKKTDEDEKKTGSGNLICACGVHQFTNQRACMVEEFGSYFWGELIKANPMLGQLLARPASVVRVCYSDNYLGTPASILAFSKVAEWLAGQSCIDRSVPLIVSVGGKSRKESGPGGQANKEQASKEKDATYVVDRLYPMRTSVDIIKQNLIDTAKNFYSVVLGLGHLPHSRKLEIHFSDNSLVVIALEQGFGCWDLADKSLTQTWLDLFDGAGELDIKPKTRELIDGFKKAQYQSFQLRGKCTEVTVRTYINDANEKLT